MRPAGAILRPFGNWVIGKKQLANGNEWQLAIGQRKDESKKQRQHQQLPNYQLAHLPSFFIVFVVPKKSPSSIRQYYLSLLTRWGPQNWWPAQSRFEVIVGAYLTQNTNWSNVEKAIANLRRARVLSVKGI